jgi:hypothetical protein
VCPSIILTLHKRQFTNNLTTSTTRITSRWEREDSLNCKFHGWRSCILKTTHYSTIWIYIEKVKSYVWYHIEYIRITMIHHNFPKVILNNFCKITVNCCDSGILTVIPKTSKGTRLVGKKNILTTDKSMNFSRQDFLL